MVGPVEVGSTRRRNSLCSVVATLAVANSMLFF
jgi:hypothetical protein